MPPTPIGPSNSWFYARGWLRGFFDGEGSVRFRDYPNRRGYVDWCREIYAVNTDYVLIQKASTFLELLSVPFRINKTRMPYHKDSPKFLFKVRISTRVGVLAFHQEVGFTTAWKIERLQRLVVWLNRPRTPFVCSRDSQGRFSSMGRKRATNN